MINNIELIKAIEMLRNAFFDGNAKDLEIFVSTLKYGYRQDISHAPMLSDEQKGELIKLYDDALDAAKKYAKQQFGETKVVSFNEEGVSKSVMKTITLTSFGLLVLNNSTLPSKINLVTLSKSIGMTSVMLILKVKRVELCTLV